MISFKDAHPDDSPLSINMELSFDERRAQAAKQAKYWLSQKHASWASQSLAESQLTDAEFAAKDAAEIARRERVAKRVQQERLDEEESSRWYEMTKGGFPLRAMEIAKDANLEASAMVAVQAWDPEKDNILVLSGPAGCGKTVAAAYWAYQRRRPWPKDCGLFLRATVFAASSRYDAERREKLMHASALVLDDLGTEYEDSKGNFRVDLDELVDTYYGDRRPLIITTNLTVEMFKARYGERVYDRLRECGAWLSLQADSMRRKLLS